MARMAANFNGQSISAGFEITAAACESRDFLHVPAAACRGYADTALTLTYGEARVRIDALASRLRAAGYGPGHRVALALDNRPEFFLYFLALAKVQASVVPLNAAMSVKELAYVIDHADVVLVVTHRGHAAHLRAALPGTTPLYVLADDEVALAGAIGPRAAGPGGSGASLYVRNHRNAQGLHPDERLLHRDRPAVHRARWLLPF
jgi:acyl-CoA synthetase (AMP-forming)/AMP-acid ligase II